MKNIVLIGFMGTGKTSVGKALAFQLKRDVVDVDLFIEAREKKKVREIFEEKGETYFRKLEKDAIAEIVKRENAVITTGGGAVLDPENMTLLKSSGILIALWAEPETIFKRVKGSRRRPLLNTEKPLEEIQKLLEKRKVEYEKADIHFKTDGKTPVQVAKMLLDLLKKEDAEKHEIL